LPETAQAVDLVAYRGEVGRLRAFDHSDADEELHAARAVLMGAGWVINVAVAEYIIYRRSEPRMSSVRAR
jgi:hypothetical protein